MRSSAVAVLAVTAILGLAGCSSDSSDGDSAGSDDTTIADTATADMTADTVAPNGESVDVQVLDNSYRPETLEVAAGTEVVFTNLGRNDHNILPSTVEPGETGDWGVATEDFAPKAEYRHVFNRPGTYTYYCSIHGTPDAGMIGKLVVTD